MDLVINHTSTDHYWFRQSRDRTSPYADYYYWSHGGPDGTLPNNWTGFFGEDCWEFDPQRCEYYLHLFAKSQADLNYHNPAVLEEVKDILRFWLDKGVAGFRCDVINVLWKESLDSGKKRLALTGQERYISQEENHRILRQLREVLDEYQAFTVGETVFVTPQQARDLCAPERRELNMVFSFQHMECDQYYVKWLKRKFRPKVFFDCLTQWQRELDWNALYLENHDQPRSIPRFGRFHVPQKLRWRIISRTSRDNARTPFQWDDGPQAGFSQGRPWLGVNHNCASINLAQQEEDPASIWNWYKDLAALRREREALRRGEFVPMEAAPPLFAYRRRLGEEQLTVLLNFSDDPARVSVQGSLLRSNYPRERFEGVLQPWEAVILE